ncbi:MAG: lysyl-tRNA synthetase, class I [Parcubacteria group bacterium Gr01-1014_56]|nr:MAG: lysyl-tRNA synthetase, class I [Parcubacteria group bacterium Gr01-1014_56]
MKARFHFRASDDYIYNMFWADRIAQEITRRFAGDIKGGKALVIRDEWTASGRGHVGSMRGVAIHGAVAEALARQGVPYTFRFEINDFDVMDSVPPGLREEEYKQYLGMLLLDVPSPDSSAKNFAEYYANDFKSAINHAGFTPEYYWGSEPYLSGQMDAVIYEALNAADTIRSIYKEVSGSVKEAGWLPISVLCPECKKIATTEASDFDGDTVRIICEKNKVEYTEGCGFKGRVSPFKGGAKLPWKVEWAAKWKVNGVMVEGGGKDHSTKGGSRDVANHISREVFTYEPPFNLPYEFILVGGKKMSSSKGRGSSAREIADLVPSKIFRLALLGKDINQQINFDPEGDTIPVLYDQYDKLAQNFWSGADDDYAQLFTQIHPKEGTPEQMFLMRFSQVAFLVQMPHLQILDEAKKLKGSALTKEEEIEIAERAQYALRWLQNYAPEKYVFKLHDTLPSIATDLTRAQKDTLEALRKDLEMNYPTSGEVMHALIRSVPLRPNLLIEPKDFFVALYTIFLGKDSGPQAGWFLAALPKEFVLGRLHEASQ